MPETALSLLKDLIKIPSFSREEADTANLLYAFFCRPGIEVHRSGNNVWAMREDHDPQKPYLLLISHHDTVKPNAGFTKNPFDPHTETGKLFGLGSNDAGAALSCMASVFLQENPDNLNLIFLAAAEEEVSGTGGVSQVLDQLPKIWAAIVGEPTKSDVAIAERGLLVLDVEVHGEAGHAAYPSGKNAIYLATEFVKFIQDSKFPSQKALLGETTLQVTGFLAGTQHNIVPDLAKLMVDVRLNEHTTHQQVIDYLNAHSPVICNITPRSTRLKSSKIAEDHPLRLAAEKIGAKTYASPTLSDWALLPFPAIKMGPGDSKRSHSADEFIYLEELEQGIIHYINLIKAIEL